MLKKSFRVPRNSFRVQQESYIVSKTVRNYEAVGGTGGAKLIRIANAGACKYCQSLAGTYNYPNEPEGVFSRHRDCRCIMRFVPFHKGYVQDVWSKKMRAGADRDKIVKLVEQDKLSGEIKTLFNKYEVGYNRVKKLTKQLSTDEIITKISGEDLVGGGCSSLAFAYIGNKAGYDVLDYRGGVSTDLFGSYEVVSSIAKFPKVWSQIKKGEKGLEIFREFNKCIDLDKEYYLAIGRHGAIVRKTKKDGLQFLELQKSEKTQNGFKSLDAESLLRRFGCRAILKDRNGNVFKDALSFLIDADSLAKSDEFIDILGYLNTK